MDYPELPEPLTFEWDSGNRTKSLNKHGVTVQEAEEVFFRHKLLIPDQRHSGSEPRFGMYGQTNAGKILFIAFTIRGRLVRVISARPADKKERKFYDQTFKKAA
ncbi:MAG: BrnT family toxin [Candidatus Doudnabacteria bacterium]|nr:BrnT family toxin [Candidatus Doudnabacteria bacterium]